MGHHLSRIIDYYRFVLRPRFDMSDGDAVRTLYDIEISSSLSMNLESVFSLCCEPWLND